MRASDVSGVPDASGRGEVRALRARRLPLRAGAAAAVGVALGLAAGFAAGVATGVRWERAWAPATPLPDSARPRVAEEAGPRGTGTDEALESALLDSWAARLELAAKLHELQALAEAGGDLSRVVDEGIARLSDRELRSVLASTVGLTPEEIGDVTDLRAFSGRLAEIAMADVLHAEDDAGGGDRVVFATAPDAAERDARSHFPAAPARIYAVFPTEGFDDEAVLVKWYRRDRPEILLFQRYPIVAGDPTGYVWMRPRGGWDPGQYRVDVYRADESMTRLASGRYWVAE